MASTSSTFSSRVKLNHKISTLNKDDLPTIHYTRTVSAGQPVSGSFRVESYCTESIRGSYIPTQPVETYQDYVAGCKEHERCLGHFCVTPRGSILLPQRLASTLGVMSNDYAKMAEQLFIRDTPSQEMAYREKLKSLMLGKSGKMRGDMPSGPVDSSARMVISLSWHLEEMSLRERQLGNDVTYFAVPRMVAKNMRVLRIPTDDTTGLAVGNYIEDSLKEGDWIIVVRPPSLWAGNVQPMKVVLWDHECFGLSPSKADEYHADHDGDEMQIYFIGEAESIEECKLWKSLGSNKFELCINNSKFPQSAYSGEESIMKHFMVHSTMSVKELLDGTPMPEIAKVARMKEAMANMFVDRLRNPEKTFQSFQRESIRGIKDVMAQQLNQGYLGDMSRQARLAASCIQYRGGGTFHIRVGSETIRSVCTDIKDIVNDTRFPLGGNSCVRAVSELCAKAQQAALDSHRVSQAVSSKLDLINNLITGGPESLVVFKSGPLPQHSWKLVSGSITYCIVKNDNVKPFATRIVASYNPVVLTAVKLLNGDTKEVCKQGIIVVCNYYDIRLSTLELYSLVELLCYRPDACKEPITTKTGLALRNMRWMTVVFANHFGKLRKIQEKGITRRRVMPETITDASSFCNFDYL